MIKFNTLHKLVVGIILGLVVASGLSITVNATENVDDGMVEITDELLYGEERQIEAGLKESANRIISDKTKEERKELYNLLRDKQRNEGLTDREEVLLKAIKEFSLDRFGNTLAIYIMAVLILILGFNVGGVLD